MERNIAQIALFAAMIAALGMVPAITLGSGVPISAQTLGVMLAGAVLGARQGAAAVGLFVLLALMGLPLLAGGRGGLGVLASPTAGFVVGFPVAAWVTGLVVENLRLRQPGIRAAIGAFLGGVVVLYIFGSVGLAMVSQRGVVESFMLSMAFVPGDLLKVGITGMLVQALSRVRPQSLRWYAARPTR